MQNSELSIRSYRQEDEPGVIALWAAVFPEEPEWNESSALISRKRTVQPELFLVCEREDMIVGTVVAGFDGVRGWVHKVATHPDFQRRGIAAGLMRAAEEALVGLGCTKLNLQVRGGNDRAVAFYRSLGYEEETRHSMSRHLSASGDPNPRFADPIVIHYVHDMDRAVAFYKAVFGVSAGSYSPGWTTLEFGYFQLALHILRPGHDTEAPLPHAGLNLLVGSIEDVQQLVEAHGGSLTELREPDAFVPVRVATFLDSEGNGFELRQLP